MGSVDNLFKKLERQVAEDLDLLAATDASFFTTADLVRLKGRWELKFELFNKVQSKLILLITCSPFWLVMSFFAGMMGLVRLATFSLMMFPTSFVIFLLGLLTMKYYFKSKGYLELVGSMIHDELKKRKTQLNKNY